MLFCHAPYERGHKYQIKHTQLFAIGIPVFDDEYGMEGVGDTVEMFEKRTLYFN